MLKLQCTTPTHNCQVSFHFVWCASRSFFFYKFLFLVAILYQWTLGCVWLIITIQQSTEAANETNRFCKQIINNNRIRRAAKIKNQTKRYLKKKTQWTLVDWFQQTNEWTNKKNNLQSLLIVYIYIWLFKLWTQGMTICRWTTTVQQLIADNIFMWCPVLYFIWIFKLHSLSPFNFIYFSAEKKKTKLNDLCRFRFV